MDSKRKFSISFLALCLLIIISISSANANKALFEQFVNGELIDVWCAEEGGGCLGEVVVEKKKIGN